jgi:hypothetical protein
MGEQVRETSEDKTVAKATGLVIAAGKLVFLDPKRYDLCISRFYNGSNRLVLQYYRMRDAM